ncbi:hypothetical protein TNCV_1757111 [Trichonephila clavipes]|nr:hypothetical protein TNCV_1757111 [Trichonephila clavipes]
MQVGANRRIARHMGRRDAAIRKHSSKNWWTFKMVVVDRDRDDRLIVELVVFDVCLCFDDHRRRIFIQRTDPVFNIAHHISPQPQVMTYGSLSFHSRTLRSSLEVHLQPSGNRHMFKLSRLKHLPVGVEGSTSGVFLVTSPLPNGQIPWSPGWHYMSSSQVPMMIPV